MAEELTLTSPLSVTTYKVVSLRMDWDAAFIKVVCKDTQGDRITVEYRDQTATDMMTTLNKADLSTGNSLHKRILNRLVLDGHLPAGSVTGSPD